nr:immunoglobulin light chain junction region [Macaca mulatta]MOX77431.1 immunoglobulin light chain junction region [Macaca mulatta]MOX77581.1 immunoglobulin light chain junction region [Macaca mulatta]MOX77669.1 immunoglobulin light chain junction region [Macaca mulatta]MOX77727.1 immunoglobulin light chain junction region [Macaca mulatta]
LYCCATGEDRLSGALF